MIICHTGTAPVDTRYLGYSWRYAVLSVEGMWVAITERAPYNSHRYVQYVPDPDCVYVEARDPLRSQKIKGSHQALERP